MDFDLRKTEREVMYFEAILILCYGNTFQDERHLYIFY